MEVNNDHSFKSNWGCMCVCAHVHTRTFSLSPRLRTSHLDKTWQVAERCQYQQNNGMGEIRREKTEQKRECKVLSWSSQRPDGNEICVGFYQLHWWSLLANTQRPRLTEWVVCGNWGKGGKEQMLQFLPKRPSVQHTLNCLEHISQSPSWQPCAPATPPEEKLWVCVLPWSLHFGPICCPAVKNVCL